MAIVLKKSNKSSKPTKKSEAPTNKGSDAYTELPSDLKKVVSEKKPRAKRAYKSHRQVKFKRLLDMPPEKKAALDAMLYEGVPVNTISATVQDGWGMFKDIKTDSLNKLLFRYKWDVIDKNIAARMGEHNGDTINKLIVEVTQEIDTIRELSSLVLTQKRRVNKLLNREKDMPMLFSQLGGEIKLMASLVQQYSELSFDLGFLVRQPKRSDDVAAIADMINTKGREMVEDALANSRRINEAASVFHMVVKKLGEGEITEAEILGE